ncbi:hypothetical protein ACFQU9_38250 [Actinomadura namibiensis]|uniref:Uncharacterized protein n=1 Tax=Actinomadura namibiensis TaxID=182080 RepID=A0A7W3LKY8_ACTNM|nr:hypothetical protein [Actinomadura namibiensis]MBA8950044.1 hypothetical protein [Actinomadura namibiensis]
MRDAAQAELPDPSPRPPARPVAEVAERLRAVPSVLDGDALLDASGPPDWAGLAAEHRRAPFGRVQRRVLVARTDCPEAFVTELLTPWDSGVANRLVVRRAPAPRWAIRAAAERIGEMRPSFLRAELSQRNVEEMILGTPHLNLLVRAVDGYDHNHRPQVRAFWECAGVLLWSRLGTDRSAWLAASASLPGHPWTFDHLVRVARRRPAVPADRADLRVLAQAPDAVLTGAVAGLPDRTLGAMADPARSLRARDALTAMIVDRLAESGVPPRELFARWVYGSQCEPATRVWAHGLYSSLDSSNRSAAVYNVPLRRLLAARFPARRPTDLIAALRSCPDAIRAEALLTAACGEQGPPDWRALVRAQRRRSLPDHVLGALAGRPGFPAALARALPSRGSTGLHELVATQSPEAARAAVTALHRIYHAEGVLNRIHTTGLLPDEEILTTGRPARVVLVFAYTLTHRTTPAENRFLGGLVRLVEEAAREAPPGFWTALLDLLPDFGGTLPELLAAARERP